jgi:hypothetical protein
VKKGKKTVSLFDSIPLQQKTVQVNKEQVSECFKHWQVVIDSAKRDYNYLVRYYQGKEKKEESE